MRVAVIGLGSMGKRRIRLIKRIDEVIEIVGVDSVEERRRNANELYGIETADSLDAITGHVDGAFVCTSPLSHAGIINSCLRKGWHVFTEINLVPDLYDENIALAKEKGLVLFLSSTFLYRDEIRYIKQTVDGCACKLNYIYHVGQYLPDWHPWENYKSFFVNDKRTNGCRELLAIELPWLTDVFGQVSHFSVMTDKISSLDVAYPDNYLIQLEHASGAKGALAVDVVSRKAVRNLEVYGEDLYVSWDGSPDGLSRYDCAEKKSQRIALYAEVDRQAGYSSFIIENAYREEILIYFKQIRDGVAPAYDFEKDRKTLDLINRIEAAGSVK